MVYHATFTTGNYCFFLLKDTGGRSQIAGIKAREKNYRKTFGKQKNYILKSKKIFNPVEFERSFLKMLSSLLQRTKKTSPWGRNNNITSCENWCRAVNVIGATNIYLNAPETKNEKRKSTIRSLLEKTQDHSRYSGDQSISFHSTVTSGIIYASHIIRTSKHCQLQ